MSDLVMKWTADTAKLLVGRVITEVRYLTEEERDNLGWNSRSIVIILNDGTAIYPSQDDEGNDAGALFTTSKTLPTIPVI